MLKADNSDVWAPWQSKDICATVSRVDFAWHLKSCPLVLRCGINMSQGPVRFVTFPSPCKPAMERGLSALKRRSGCHKCEFVKLMWHERDKSSQDRSINHETCSRRGQTHCGWSVFRPGPSLVSNFSQTSVPTTVSQASVMSKLMTYRPVLGSSLKPVAPTKIAWHQRCLSCDGLRSANNSSRKSMDYNHQRREMGDFVSWAMSCSPAAIFGYLVCHKIIEYNRRRNRLTHLFANVIVLLWLASPLIKHRYKCTHWLERSNNDNLIMPWLIAANSHFPMQNKPLTVSASLRFIRTVFVTIASMSETVLIPNAVFIYVQCILKSHSPIFPSFYRDLSESHVHLRLFL